MVRGFMLIPLVPIAFLAWLFVHSWAQGASLSQAIYWYDFNFVAAMINGPFSPFIPSSERPDFIGVRKMRDVIPHRITVNDLN